MREYRLISIVGLLFVASTATLSAAHTKVPMKEERPGLLGRATVKADVAEATAQARFPQAKPVSAEIEEENGKLIYSFDLKTKGEAASTR